MFQRDLENGRADLQGGHRLRSVEIRFKDTFVRGFRFSHRYTGSLANDHTSYLMLKGITEYDIAGDSSSLGYDFDYYEGSLPGRLSHSKDHWGYYNGKNNPHAIPQILNDSWDLDGADREPDLAFARRAALKRITYPTRGYTEYEYELNDYNNVAPERKFNHITHSAMVGCDGTGTVTDTETFTLPANGYVTLNSDMPCENQSVECSYTIKRNGLTYNFTLGAGNRVYADAGVYTITVSLGSESNNSYAGEQASVSLTYDIPEEIPALPGGGLRIKRIIFNDGQATAYSKTFDYTLPSGITSGKIMTHPRYTYISDVEYGSFNLLQCEISGRATYYVRNASSNAPLATTQGSYVGYERVTVYNESNSGVQETGKSVSEFSNHLNNALRGYPFIYDVSFDYKNGLLLKQTDYAYRNSIYEPVRVVENHYTFSGAQKIHGMQAAVEVSSPCVTCSYNYDGNQFVYNTSYDQSETMQLASTTETHITENGSNITRHYHQYDPVTYLRTKTFTYNADGTLHYTLYQYPNHYNGGAMSGMLSGRKASGVLIEKQIWLGEASIIPETSAADPGYVPNLADFRLIYAVYNVYDARTQPVAQFFLRTDQPLAASAFTPSQGNDTPEDTHYERESTINAYDSHGNLLSYTDKKGYTTSLTWGYNHTLPVAEASNAAHEEIYLQNFEDDLTATKSETDAHTGEHYWNAGSFTVNFTPPGSKVYLMDYWYFNGSTWVAVIGEPFSASINSGGTRLDDIRVYPEDAKITSYTYKPGWGIQAVIDANGIIHRYTYDSFGRLSEIKDNEGDIVKQIEYNYIK